MSHDMWFPTMCYFDKCRLRWDCAASFKSFKLQMLFGQLLNTHIIFKRLAKALIRLRRLTWGFAGRTYHIVGNLMSRLIYVLDQDMRKPVFRVSEKVRFKPACSATDISLTIEISPVASLHMTRPKKRITKALIRLGSVPVFFTDLRRQVFFEA